MSLTPVTQPEIPNAGSGPSNAKSLLQRVILPRAGEPLDVRSLYLVEDERNARRAHAPSRTSVLLGAESQVSFETYFNAFAASYWRRWSILDLSLIHISEPTRPY